MSYAKVLNPLSAEEHARAIRAAAGEPALPAGPVPMGIRYKNVPATASPKADRRQTPDWALMLAATPTEALEQLSRTSRTHQIPKTRARQDTAPAAEPAQQRAVTPAPRAKKPAARKPAARPRVLRSRDAYSCLSCGSRYSFPATDHRCGPLTPVTVAVIARTSRAVTGQISAYDTFACWDCGDRFDTGDAEHGCGPLTPATVTITHRTGGEQA